MKKQILCALIPCLALMANASSSVQLERGKVDPLGPPLVIQPFSAETSTWFDVDKYILKPAGKQQLDDLIRTVSSGMQRTTGISATEPQAIIGREQGKEPTMFVIGHTDSTASYEYNQVLSENRAKAVANYLISRGVPSNLIVWSGRGEMEPVATNKTAAGRQKNRRVEIQLDGPSIKVVGF